MLYLRTGLPGSGKTLNTIREIELEHGPDPKNPDKPLRPVYYYGIPDLDISKLGCNWIEFDTPDNWFDLPDGSIIVIDEAQRVFGAQDGRKARPEKVARFETHRHQGFDIHLVTQHPSLIMKHVRALVGKHINMYRPYGGKRLIRHEYEFCIDSPEKRSNFKLAQERRVKLDPKYYGVYKSATVHTHKFKLPNYVWAIPPLVAFILGAIFFVYWLYVGSVPAPADVVETPAADSSQLLPAANDLNSKPPASASAPAQGAAPAPMTPEEYADSLKPRIEDVPSTAPRYDRLTEPKSFPRLSCVISFDPMLIDRLARRGAATGETDGRSFACQCYTQQTTRYSTSAEFCRTVTENGYFDDTIPDPLPAAQHVFNPERQSAATGRGPAAQMPQTATYVPPPIVSVGGGKPGLLW